MTPRVGLIGLGEAGAAIGGGLASAGAEVRAFDVAAADPDRGPLVRQRAADAGVTLVDAVDDLAADSDAVLSLVTAAVAVAAAESVAPSLGPGHVYADLNSAAPQVMRQVAAVVEGAGAEFVDAAVMAAVPPHGHRVPMLLSGPGADRLVAALRPLGADLEVIGTAPGAASAVKLSRSLLVKGLEALFWECTIAASAFDATDRVYASLEGAWPGEGWEAFAGYLMGRTVQHGQRRAHEMEEAAQALRDAGVEPLMATAAAARLRLVAEGVRQGPTDATTPAALARLVPEGG